jgi:hypothetical protein
MSNEHEIENLQSSMNEAVARIQAINALSFALVLAHPNKDILLSCFVEKTLPLVRQIVVACSPAALDEFDRQILGIHRYIRGGPDTTM